MSLPRGASGRCEGAFVATGESGLSMLEILRFAQNDKRAQDDICLQRKSTGQNPVLLVCSIYRTTETRRHGVF